jgi:hypothetical protein
MLPLHLTDFPHHPGPFRDRVPAPDLIHQHAAPEEADGKRNGG